MTFFSLTYRLPFWILLMLTVIGFASGAAAVSVPDIRYAEGFRVEPFKSFTLVSVKPARGDGAPLFRYLLVPRGKTPPEDHPPAQVVRVPVRRVAALSTTYLAYMDAAGVVDRLAALNSFKHVNTPSVRRRIGAGELREVGNITGLRIEVLLDLSPDLILTSAAGSVFDAQPKLKEAGLTTAVVADHLEAHPLGRCEWIKYLALFFGTTDHAAALFDGIEARYLRLADMASKAPGRPAVLVNAPFRGQWWVPGGGSFVARFIRDAGGAYLWADVDGGGSRAFDIEAVYDRALNADVWLNTAMWTRIDDALAADPRFADVKALKTGRVFNNNKRLNEHGGNDYWESGMLRPEVILADLIKILHPDLLPDHEWVYYRRLEGSGRDADGRSR
jgi:iron complex transport system substrate-binding protein